MESSFSVPWTPSSPGNIPENLERSVRLLDDAIGPQRKSLLRMSNTPRKRGQLHPGRDDSFNSTSSFLSPISRIRSGKSQRDSVLGNLSFSIAPGEYSQILDGTTGQLLIEEEPWKSATNKLFEEFLESLQSQSGEFQVFDQVSEFIQNCTSSLNMVKNIRRKTISSQHPGLIQDLAWIENERNTWRLVHCLYQYRLTMEAEGEDADAMMVDDPTRILSERDIVRRLYKTDAITMQCQLVVDWLEKNAGDEMLDPALPQPQHFADKSVSWENTLFLLKNKEKGIPYGSTRPVVSRLDPDAPVREQRPLHDLDKEDEVRLMHHLFILIRCGRLEQAQTVCCHCGQPWRAATLEGWKLYHDPNMESHNTEEKEPVEGNPNRDVWKLVAWRMTNDERLPYHTRATFAALCGNLRTLLPACLTWHDMLWAYFKVFIDIRVETEIRSCSVRSYQELPQTYWNNKMTLNQVFAELAASKDPKIQKESSIPYHIVQKYLILDEIPTLMDEMEHWVQDLTLPPHLLRFLAHLVLFLRQIGRLTREEVGNYILEAYVKVLVSLNEVQLVAFYVATLPQEDQVELYASFLQNITDIEEKKRCLNLAEEAGLDLPEVTKKVVENIRNKETSDASGDLKGELTEEDLEKIEALDWVVIYPDQRDEAMSQSNAIIRHFLASGKLEAAKKAFQKIPQDSIDLIIKQWRAICGTEDDMPQHPSNIIREHLCYRAYLDAQESFSDWFQHFHHAKPKLPILPSGASFTEKVAFEHRESQYKADLDRWKMSVEHQSKTVKSRLYNVLLFPEGGWLVDVNQPLPHGWGQEEDEGQDEDKSRQLQLDSLRKLCIPQIVLLLHTVMHNIGAYNECLQLADVLVSEQSQLYKVYTKERMGEILGKICESSLALMDQKKDPWGHPVSS